MVQRVYVKDLLAFGPGAPPHSSLTPNSLGYLSFSPFLVLAPTSSARVSCNPPWVRDL